MGWEYLLYAVVMSALSYAIQAATAPKPEAPKAGQLDIPTAEVGRPVPVPFGTNIIKQSNVVWFGDASTTPIKKKAGK